MNNYKCGHCESENITLERQDGSTVGDFDFPDAVIFRIQCQDCGFTVAAPVPKDYANGTQFNPEIELLDIWDSASKKAYKHKKQWCCGMIEVIENTKKAQDQYGHLWGSEHIIITKEQIQALLDGKQIAFDDDEHVYFISMSEPK